jgi:molybdopterin-containing oxidoreductase family iron-sulfur binding subunit
MIFSLIVSVGRFLGDWQGGGMTQVILKAEFLKWKMSRHFQLEANMTLSGAADKRLPMSANQNKH